MPHNFSYEVKQPEYGNYYGHEVVANEEQINGRYFVLLPDGQVMTVTYVADHDGFRPEIEFEPFVKEGMFADFVTGEEAREKHAHGKNNGNNKGSGGGTHGTTAVPLTAPPGSLLMMPAVQTMMAVPNAALTTIRPPIASPSPIITTPGISTMLQYQTPSMNGRFIRSTLQPIIDTNLEAEASNIIISTTTEPPETQPPRLTQPLTSPPGSSFGQRSRPLKNKVSSKKPARVIRSTTSSPPTTRPITRRPVISTTTEVATTFISQGITEQVTESTTVIPTELPFAPIEETSTNPPAEIFTPPSIVNFRPERIMKLPEVTTNFPNEELNDVAIEVILPPKGKLAFNRIKPRSRKKKKSWKPPKTAEPLVGGPVRLAKMLDSEDTVITTTIKPQPLIGGPVRKFTLQQLIPTPIPSESINHSVIVPVPVNLFPTEPKKKIEFKNGFSFFDKFQEEIAEPELNSDYIEDEIDVKSAADSPFFLAFGPLT